MTYKQTFVVIGAAGFLGSSFCKYLRNLNHNVFEILRGQISGIESDFNFLSKILKSNGNHIVIDFSYTSIPNTSFQDPIRDYTENLYNVIRHLEFVKQLPNSLYIYVSSGGTVYGNPLRDKPVSEEHPNIPLSPYGITKLSCEKYVLMYREVHGVKTKIVRPSNIFGPGQKPFRGQGLIATAIAKMRQGHSIQVFGDGQHVRDYLFIDDFCEALYDIIKYGANDTYNIGSGIGLSINQLLLEIAEAVGLPLSVERLPERPFDVRYNVLDVSKLRSLNNWRQCININEGISKSIKWLQNKDV